VLALEMTSWSWPGLACRQCHSRGRDVGNGQCVISTMAARACYGHDCVQCVLSTTVACACYDHNCVRESFDPPR